MVKVQVEGFGALLAKALEEAGQEYRAYFKETNDYLDLMQDATEEYKAQLKKVNPDFDAKHYDKLIFELEEPQIPTPEELDLIRTSGNVVGLIRTPLRI